MQNRHYPPAYLRYLKARLWNLRRPSFWGTAIFLFIFGLGMWQYLSNADVFADNQQLPVASPQVADSSFSAEDKALVADIDNFPVLIKDYQQANVVAGLSIPEENSPAKNRQNLFDDVISKQPSANNDAKSNLELGIVNGIPTPKENNPFVVQADNLLQMKSASINSHLLGTKSLTEPSQQTASTITPFNQEMGFTNQTDKNQNPVTISPLQAAINQSPNQNLSGYNNTNSSPTNIMGTASYSNTTSINQNLSGYNNTNSSPTNIMGTTSYNEATITPASNTLPTHTLPANTSLSQGTNYTQPTATNLPQNFYTNFNNSQTSSNRIPATAVTLPTTSAATTNISPYSTPTPVKSVVNLSTPSIYQSTQLPQSRTSLRRPTPGPYGGVQINGYAYP